MSTATGEAPGKRAPRKRKSVSSKKKATEPQAGNGADVADSGESQLDAIEIHGGPAKDAPKAEVLAWLAELPPMERTKDLLAAAKKRLGLAVADIRSAIKQEIKRRDEAEKERKRAERVQQREGFTIFGGNMSPGARPKRQPDPAGVIWPSGFTMKKSGLWYEAPPRNDGSDPDSVWICAPFHVVAETSGEGGYEHGLLLCWASRHGHDLQWAMPQAMVHKDGNEIAAELQGAGLSCGTTRAAHEQLKHFLGAVGCEHRTRCVDRAGWLDVGFILPNSEVFGEGENHE
jgi:hypothetical protein